VDFDNIRFVQARNFSKVDPLKPRPIDLIVLHSMEAGDSDHTALSVALWFAGPNSPKASAHYCVSSTEIIQCVRDEDCAWAAPGTNHNGIHIEQAGYAHYTSDKWLTPPCYSVIRNTASLMARISAKYDIPLELSDAEALLLGKRGVTLHQEITKACRLAKIRRLTQSPYYNAQTDHVDPGIGYPITEVLQFALLEQQSY
jgi:N-acetylmuramoyl-L-alanine amidase